MQGMTILITAVGQGMGRASAIAALGAKAVYDLTPMITFLLSDNSRFVTRQAMFVDGRVAV
jgi:NAD(P)-dependent dehydrogenase (short-subunit alcohol dehydrogenase family)